MKPDDGKQRARHRSASELETTLDHLERRLAERTRELERARSLAEAANLTNGAFLARLSHEIRTPMNAVIGFTELALETPSSDEQRELLTKSRSASESLLSIIDEVLDFSKIAAGKLELDPVEFGLDEVLDRVAQEAAQRACQKGLRWTLSIADETPMRLIGDPLRLEQVLLHLIGNSVEFSERGEVAVSVGSKSSSENHVRLEVSVRDTGIGIAPQQREALFAAYRQADIVRKRRGGMGLGLFISKHLVEMMGGEIWADPTPGGGTTMRFTARLEVGPADSHLSESDGGGPSACAAEPDNDGTRSRIDGVRVLVVDDHSTNREVARSILERAGARVTVAENGREAIETVCSATGSRRYDAVLMDLEMPEVDGYQAAASIRTRFSANELPIIAMSAHTAEEERQRCLRSGMNDRVSKPVDSTQLVATLGRWVNAVHRHRAEDSGTNAPEVDSLSLPDRVDGIAIGDGVRRVSGDAGLYRRLLEGFSVKAVDTSARISAALEGRDRQAASRAAHEIKGLAGNLSAKELYERASELETALRAEGAPSVDALIERFERALGRVLSALDAHGLNERRGPTSIRPGRRPPADGLVERLRALDELLKRRDLSAEKCFEGVVGEYDLSGFTTQVADLASRLERLQYDSAAEVLASMLRRVETGSS